MRAIDWRMSVAVRNHWKGQEMPDIKICPLLADLDRLLVYLDEAGITPGHVVDPCPECGQEHRWALLHELMIHALDIRPASQSKLLRTVDKKLEEVRAFYGGEDGYRSMRQDAEAFFTDVDSGRVFKR